MSRWTLDVAVVAAALAATLVVAPAGAQSVANADRVARAVRAERIRTHVSVLADDSLEGRGTGQRGGRAAALYVAGEMRRMGLLPGGDSGGYLQRVPLVRRQPDGDMVMRAPNGDSIALVFARDFGANIAGGDSAVDIRADVIYAYGGIHAPETERDDYRGVDVRGKIVLVRIASGPADSRGDVYPWRTSPIARQQLAKSLGAAALLFI